MNKENPFYDMCRSDATELITDSWLTKLIPFASDVKNVMKLNESYEMYKKYEQFKTFFDNFGSLKDSQNIFKKRIDYLNTEPGLLLEEVNFINKYITAQEEKEKNKYLSYLYYYFLESNLDGSIKASIDKKFLNKSFYVVTNMFLEDFELLRNFHDNTIFNLFKLNDSYSRLISLGVLINIPKKDQPKIGPVNDSSHMVILKLSDFGRVLLQICFHEY